MPIDKRFSKATAEHIKKTVPLSPGIYELKAFGDVKYVGSSARLRERLLTHNRERNPNQFRFKVVDGIFSSHTKAEKRHYHRHIEKYGEPPEWNGQEP